MRSRRRHLPTREVKRTVETPNVRIVHFVCFTATRYILTVVCISNTFQSNGEINQQYGQQQSLERFHQRTLSGTGMAVSIGSTFDLVLSIAGAKINSFCPAALHCEIKRSQQQKTADPNRPGSEHEHTDSQQRCTRIVRFTSEFRKHGAFMCAADKLVRR